LVEVNTSGRSEEELRKAARRKLPKAGWYDGDIEDALETTSQNNNEMFKCTVSFVDQAGEKWTLTTYLLDTPKTGLIFRHACAARGVLAKFEAGSVDQSDLPGPVRIKIGIEKRRGWPDRLIIEDYAAPASASVVNLRSAG
jgi:hypothetical protein